MPPDEAEAEKKKSVESSSSAAARNRERKGLYPCLSVPNTTTAG